jgi:glycosyltransferase involved in cell wall biosynthesis
MVKIAILGTRGIPARYGGFETLAEQLATRLAARGHDVSVYCRKAFTTPDDRFDERVRRVILPSIGNKYLDTVTHTLLSVLHVVTTDVDVVLLCNVGNSPLAWIPRVFGIPVALNVDELDRKRRKWNWFARTFLLLCEMICLLTPTRLITDAAVIREYFLRRYGQRAEMIAYGAEPPEDVREAALPFPRKKFVLYVSRFEPENNPDLVVKAYRRVQSELPLVMVGGNRYDGKHAEELRAMADDRVVFTGPVYGDGYWALQKSAAVFIFASEVGGVHPALVEAMAAGGAIVYLDTPENRETAGDAGIPFARDEGSLAQALQRLLSDAALREALGQRAKARAREKYGWDGVADAYERLFREMLGAKEEASEVSEKPESLARERSRRLAAPARLEN